MSMLLQFTLFILISSEMGTLSQTTHRYDEQHYIQEEFMKFLDDSEKDLVSDVTEFISSSTRNRIQESQPPMTLSHYCLLQTIWALASGRVELAKTYVNRTLVCYHSTSEEWLENFQFDPSLVFEIVKSSSNINEDSDILKRVAVYLSRNYNVLVKAAERGDNSLISWLKKAGLDFTQSGRKAIASAWIKDRAETVSLLLEMGAFGNNSASDVASLANAKGETLLHLAAGRGLRSLAIKLLGGGAAVDQKDVDSLTPLYHAVRSKKKEMVRLLLQRGADLMTRSESGNTLLHLAVMENSSAAILGLSEFGLEIQAENYEEIPPLYFAAELDYHLLMDLLTKRGASSNYKTSSGNYLLHIAVNRGSLIAVKNLIKYGALTDSKNGEELTPLYLAANVGNTDLIWLLLNKGASRRDDASGDSLLHIAARRGDTQAIESLVNFCIPVDEMNNEGLTPLYSAASTGKRAAMELLLYKGADLYITLGNGLRLIHAAAVKANIIAIESLLSQGIHVDVKDTEILTALCRAVQKDSIVSVALLIEKGANTSFRTTDGDTLLHIAAASNSYESIQLLVEHGLNIDAENERYETPLYLAAKNNNTKMANLLVNLGANKNYVTSKFGTLAHLAAETNDFVALKALFDIGVDFNSIDKHGYTPLYATIRESKVITANFMLEIGVELFFIDQHNDSLLHIAGRNNDHKAIDFLIDRGLYIDSQGSNGSRPVDVALYGGHCETAEYFIKKGANVRGRNGMNWTLLHSAVIGDCGDFLKNVATNIDIIDTRDRNLQTPLHWASALGRTAIANTLLMMGANVNSVDKYNSTPFLIAVVNRHWDIVTLFSKKDVKNLDWTYPGGRTLLHLAALENEEYIVKYLTEQIRANIYVQDKEGKVPLHLAAGKGWYRIMTYLIDERVPKSIDYRDNEGKTALHLAAIGGHESSVDYLLNEGADPVAADCHQQTPLIYAAKHHYWNIAERLLSKACMISGTNDTDEEKRTVLHFAVLDGKHDIISNNIECLKKMINNKDSKENTPLDLAMDKKDWYIVRIFFQHYPILRTNDCISLTLAKFGLWDILRNQLALEMNSKCRDEKNRTLLHWAAWHGDEYTVLTLLESRITYLDAMDVDNRTALHLAAIKRRPSILRILLKNSARNDIDYLTLLTIAIANNDWESVRELLEKKSAVTWRDAYNRTLLHHAAINGKTEILEYLLRNTEIGVNDRDINMDTPLQLVASQNHLSSYERRDIIDLLARNGADWKMLNKERRSLLHLVTISGDKNSLDYILNRFRLDINGQDINSQTPLHIAAIKRHSGMLNTLLESGADRNIRDVNHSIPLLYAIKNRLDEINLLDTQTNISWSDSNNRSLLHLAAMYGCSGVVRKLLISNKKKANFDQLDANEQTPLHLAARKNDTEIVDLLLNEGANGERLDKENRTALNLAVISNSWKTVDILVRRGYYKEDRYERNRTLLQVAIMNGVRYLIDSLINDKITDLSATDDFEDTPLHTAARKNDVSTVKLLLDKRVEKDVANSEGQSPLMVAAVSGHWDSVRALLEGNCDVEGIYGSNRTILHLAAINGKREIIDHLLSCRNVDINALDGNRETPLDLLLKNNRVYDLVDYSGINWRDGRGRTILHYASSEEFIDYYRYLRYLSGLIDAEDNERRTPLHLASLVPNNGDVINQLISHGANIDAADIDGLTPLHLAAMNGHTANIEECILQNKIRKPLDYGSIEVVFIRLNARDSQGRTPLQLSLDFGHKETATVLKQYGGII